MKTICAGYRDKDGNIVQCGKLIKDGVDDGQVSHGMCNECFEKFKELL